MLYVTVYRDRHDTIQARRGDHPLAFLRAVNHGRHILYRAVIDGSIVEDDMNEAGTP
jgi:hypothetical protein